jgi:hypothetical protein
MKSSKFPVYLVGGAILIGIAIIIVSLFSNHIRWDRETLVSAAKYDGENLIKQLADLPATSTSFREVEEGPLAPDLSNAREAWITWKESFASQVSFPDLTASYRSRLGTLEWVATESADRNVARFSKGEWTLTLTLLPGDGTLGATRVHRLIEWRVVVP